MKKEQGGMHEGHRQRLRQEYLAHGGEAMPDHRFLELLLTYAIPRRDVNEPAHRLLARFGSLEGVCNAETAQLLSVEGVGEAAAVFLSMQGELCRRLALGRLADARGRTQLNTPIKAARFALARLGRRAYESVELVCLNAKRRVEHVESLQRGVVAEASLYPRQIAETALLRRAHSVILLHNHPSGNPVPSPADRSATEAARAALAPVEVSLADHLIVGSGCVYSFAADAILELAGKEAVAMSIEDYESAAAARQALHRVMENY
ncbi:MAG: DNA repair protein RadC [Clostridia bacterium]|nr:DNA repair protein RadC [Clostridia bacterium]